MFKRANKITSLLIAAAAVVSLVPASAADVKKIDSQDGTVYNAVAYKDGKFYVDGELEDKDEASYYVEDGNFTALDDVDSGSDVTTYGTKYVNVEDGDYFVDLENGSVTDDSIKDDAEDDAASALRKKVKKDNDGRYLDSEEDKIATLTEVPGKVFGEIWYSTSYKYDATNSRTLFTDADGNYIDADYNLGKIKVNTTGQSVNVENLKDTVDFGKNIAGTADAKDSLSVAITTPATGAILGQDKDNIYRLATITLTVDTTLTNDRISEVYGKKIADADAFRANGTASVVAFDVIQKISKAQDSDDVDGAKYAKTVTNYVISKDSGDALDDALLAQGSDDVNAFAVTADGKITSYRVDGKNIKAETITLKAKSGLYYTDISDGDDSDLEVATSYQFDVDGNLFALEGGYIKKYNNDDSFDKVYKVDGSFDKLSVYDKDNMVAWNEDDEVYSIIGGKSTDETPVDETPVVTAGWAQAANGTWTYNKADGTKATGWLLDGATWYYLKADGVMATGWVQDGATWYYTNASGAMATGWVNDNGTWYYCNASGAMLANTTVDGYVLGASGAWVK